MARMRITAPIGKQISTAGGHAVASIEDGITPVLRGMMAKMNRSRELMLVLGRAGEKNLRAHFAMKDQKPNKRFPEKRTHFWARLRRMTALDGARTTATEAVIATADRALAGPVFGPKGVKAKPPNKMLAIPLIAAAYGIRPRSGLIKGLEFMIHKEGWPGLGVEQAKLRKQTGRAAGFRGANYSKRVFYYRLVPSVDIPKDPTALPTPGAFQEALAKALHIFCRTAFGTKIYKSLGGGQ